MKCCDAENYIMKYIDGEISKKEAEELNQHIKQCESCKQSFLFYDNMMQDFEQMPLYEAPEDFERNVMMQIQLLAQSEKRSFTKNKIMGYLWGSFTIFFGAGAILAFYKESIIGAMEENVYFSQWVEKITPIEQNIMEQGHMLQTATRNALYWTDEMLCNHIGILLLLLCIVCAVRCFLVRKKGMNHINRRK